MHQVLWITKQERKNYIVLLNKLKKSAYFKNVNKSGNNFYPDVKILSLLSDFSHNFNCFKCKQ